MTSQQKKQWLMRSRAAAETMSELELAYREAYDLATRTVASYKGEGGGTGATDSHWKMDKVAELGEMVSRQVGQLAVCQTEVAAVIERVDDPQLRLLLTKRYMRWLSWDEIADDMFYSRRHILRMHGAALAAVVIPEDVTSCHR